MELIMLYRFLLSWKTEVFFCFEVWQRWQGDEKVFCYSESQRFFLFRGGGHFPPTAIQLLGTKETRCLHSAEKKVRKKTAMPSTSTLDRWVARGLSQG